MAKKGHHYQSTPPIFLAGGGLGCMHSLGLDLTGDATAEESHRMRELEKPKSERDSTHGEYI